MWQLVEKIGEISSRIGIRWTNPLAGFLITLFFGTVGIGFAGTIFGSARLLLMTAFTVTFMLLGLGLWIFSCRLPRNSTEFIGIAIAIDSENGEERKRIKADFISQITDTLENESSAFSCKVIEIPSFLAPSVNDEKHAYEMLNKCKAHLLIWGSVRTRKKAGKEMYIVRLEGVTTHASIEVERSQALGIEMRAAIPKKTEIDLANELRGFEIASHSIVFAARYIVALAAAASGDWHLSKNTLLQLIKDNKNLVPKKSGGKIKKSGTSKLSLVDKLPHYLSQVYFAEVISLIAKWRLDKEKFAYLEEAENILEHYRILINKLSKEGTEYWITKAMMVVTLRNDYAEAEVLLNRCKAHALNDPTWRLSLAFILMIQGKVDNALIAYDAALERKIPVELAFDVEDYVQWWLEKNKGPDGLLLLSAMLNIRAKADPALALKDLEDYEYKLGNDIPLSLRNRITNLKTELKLEK